MVAFGVFIAADDLTVVTTMLRPIISDLGLVLPDGLDDAAWIVNAYLIAYVSVMPFMGRLSDVLGRRRVYIGALTLFLIGSIIIPMTNTLGPFLFGRVLTAMGGGALVPIGMAAVSDAYVEGKRARALGVLGAVDTLGWVWGPLYGAMIIRFLAWRWQFYFNIPLAILGIVAAWYVLSDSTEEQRAARIDWTGAALLTTALVALNLALLGAAEIQSVTGLEELTGGTGAGLVWLYPVALAAGVAFVYTQRRTEYPLIDPGLFRGRNLVAAVTVNFFVGATLVIAMVDVPLFINVVEVDLERAAVITGWVLSALTASMSVASYLGGRITESRWYRPPVLIGLGMSAAGFFAMGFGWDVMTAYPAMALQLAVLGAGFGLVMAPTTAAVVDAAPADRRGTAASLVMVLRLMGLSVGLSGLTAWGLHRFNQLRKEIDLPALTDPDYAQLAAEASAELTTASLAETFVAAGVLVVIAWFVALLMRRTPRERDTRPGRGSPQDHSALQQSDALQDSTKSGQSTNPTAAKGVPMKQFIVRHLSAIVVATAAVVFALLVATILMAVRISSLSSDLEEAAAERTQLVEDMSRVEGGAALYAAQITAFQQQLGSLGPTLDSALSEAVVGIETFRTSQITFDVAINETVPIDTQVVLDRTLDVPIQTTLPIDETIDTTITVNGPFGIDIPLDITVPIQLDLPIDLDVAIPVNETIPIQTEVPVNLDVPIVIDIAETELAALAEALQQGLESFRQMAAGLS
ncbi:MAG: MFS transporter [Acidimicrobiia bacterium]|nr:MFS transporter [Acidimicrobiia bacterium]